MSRGGGISAVPPFPFAASDEINRILYATVDPTVEIDGQPIPALTTLLLGVCGNDPVKFTEATRLVELFIANAMEQVGGRIMSNAPPPPFPPPTEVPTLGYPSPPPAKLKQHGADLRDGPNSNTEIVRRRLADGRTIADADVHRLVAEIDRLRALIRGGSA